MFIADLNMGKFNHDPISIEYKISQVAKKKSKTRSAVLQSQIRASGLPDYQKFFYVGSISEDLADKGKSVYDNAAIYYQHTLENVDTPFSVRVPATYRLGMAQVKQATMEHEFLKELRQDPLTLTLRGALNQDFMVNYMNGMNNLMKAKQGYGEFGIPVPKGLEQQVSKAKEAWESFGLTMPDRI